MKVKSFNDFLMEEAGEPVGLTGGGNEPQAEEAPPVQEQPEFEGPEWMASLAEDLRQEKSLQSFKDINDLAKSFVSTKKMVGKDKVFIPDETATQEDWEEFYNRLGRPEKEKYEVKFGEAQYSDDFKNGFKEKAYEAGLLPKQAEGLFEFFNEQVQSANEVAQKQAQEELQQELQGLQKEWGAGYEKKIATAQKAFGMFADEDITNYLNETGLANDTKLIKLFAKIGESLNEDTFERNTVSHLGMTKEEAQDKIDSMMGNGSHPYWDENHVNHKKAVDEMLKYRKIVES